MLNNKKYLYLITFGGLNDTINQIMFGYKYCLESKRILVVDTKHSRQERDIQDYFDLKNKIIFQGGNSEFAQAAKSMSVYPQYEIDSLKFKCNATENEDYNILASDIKIDLTIERKEEVLIYGNPKGDNASNEFFKFFPMKENIKQPLQKRYNSLPSGYISVHIRNTDYQSNVSEFIDLHKHIFEGKNIFLASDNTESIAEFKNKINAKIYTFSNIPKYVNDLDGRFRFHPEFAIHKCKVDNKEELNIDSIVDLVLLSLGENVYCSCPHSGYSSNAKIMNADNEFKKNVLSQIRFLITIL